MKNIAHFNARSALMGALVLGLFVAWYSTNGINGQIGAVGLAVSLLCGMALLVVFCAQVLDRRRSRKRLSDALKLVQDDIVPSFMADRDGVVLYSNRSSEREALVSVSELLAPYLAQSNMLLLQLQAKADEFGHASENIATKRGTVQLGVTKFDENAYVWRLIEPCGMSVGGADALPSMTVGPSGTILYMNDKMRELIGERAKRLDHVFRDLPLVSGDMHQVKCADRNVSAMVATLEKSGGRTEIFLLPGADKLPKLNIVENWAALELLPVPLILVANTGEVVARNREASKLLGAQLADGSRISDILEGLGRPITDWFAEVAAGRGSGARQFLRGTGDNRDFFVQVALAQAGDPEQKYVIATLNDMTEFKSLEAQFVQSQKMQAIGQLAGGVAHDFNNLLTAISGHCDLLLLKHDQEDGEYADLIQIHQNANRAASLVGQLLAFSRKQNLNFEVVDLRDTLSDLTYLLNRLVGEKVKLVLHHDADLKPIRVDKRQLEQVIMNLVVNARDAMPSGGEIRVETENVVLEKPIRRNRALLPADSYVLVKVIDEGVGIAPEKIGKIFEPFFTTKRTGEGTGLGLSTAYGIVKQTGGFIFAESEVGVGTVFSIYLPAFLAQKESVTVEQATTLPERNGPRETDNVVLLVEDEAPVRAFAS